MKEIIACLLCLMLLQMHAAAQENPALKQKVLDIPVGEFVEIRTMDKLKIRGRIGAATNDAVAIETICNGKPETVEVEFANMKSIHAASPVERSTGEKIASRTGQGVVAALAAVGVVVLVVGVVMAGR